MVRFLLLLPLLLLPRLSDAQSNYCYCTTPWTANATFGQSCTANTACWACQPGAYSTTWQQAFCSNYQAPTCQTETQTQVLTCQSGYAGQITQTRTKTCTTSGQGIWGDWITTSNTCTPICQVETQTQTQSCPVNYSGIITQTKTKTCPSGVWGDWQTTQNTCTPNPPTCQVTTESQTLACQIGYTGSITQTRSSTCPNPYGQPVFGAWVTTLDSCKKSITNTTNPVSPVSPLNPASPTSSTSVQTTPSSPVIAPTPSSVPNSQTTTDGLNAPTAGSSAQSSTAQTDAKGTSTSTKTDAPTTTASPTTSSTPTSTGNQSRGPRLVTPLGLALSLELFVKPGLTQPSLFPSLALTQQMPIEMVMQDSVMGLMFQPTINQYLEPQDLGFEQ